MVDSRVLYKRVVFVTGVSRGIGREIFAQGAAKKDTCIIGISRSQKMLDDLAAECARAKYSDYYLFAQDLTDPELSTTIIDCLQQVGRVDALINCAGYLVNKPFLEISKTDWLQCYMTNVYGPFRLIQQLVPWLSKSEVAHVVNIGSMGGVQGSAKFAGLSAYSSSKAAMIGLTECLAEELKDTPIRTNIINLGAVQTEMLSEAFPGLEVKHQPADVARWLLNFAFDSGQFMNGKSVQLSDSTP